MVKYGVWGLTAVAAIGIAGVVWLRSSQPPPTIQPTHIVLISIDTCRADHLGCYGHSPSRTPNLDALAEEGVLFENVIAPAPMTLPSHCTMLTGTIPPYHGVRDNGDYYLDDVHVTLPEILRGEGFVTGAVISAFVLDSRYGLDQGFDTYDDQFDEGLGSRAVVERKGDETTDHAVAWLERHRDKKGFLFLHYFDPHQDYEAPGPWGERFADQPYLGEIAYTDHCIGKVVQKLKDLGIYDSTLLIVTSDHGEMLGEHGEVTHMYFIYQAAVRVPLMIKLPGPSEPRKIESLVGVVDIAPTVCGLLGIEMAAPVQGTSLVPLISGGAPSDDERPQYCESITPTKYNANPLFGLVASRWKYIHTTSPELYDLHTDAGETNNLVQHEPKRAIAMLNQLEQLLQLEPPEPEGDRSVRDEESSRRLGSLGYLGGATVENDFTIDPIRSDPKDLIALHNPAMNVNAYLEHEQYSQARKICEEFVDQHPGIREGHFLLARIAMGERNYVEAAEHFSRSLAIQPDDALAHNRLGNALWEVGQQDRAVTSVRRALELRPAFPEAHGNLGRFLVGQGDVDEGIQHLRKAVELSPDFEVAHQFLANTYLKTNEVEQAAHHYGHAIRINQANASAHFGLAQVRGSQGRQDEAIDHFRLAISANPKFAAAHQNLGNLLQSQGKQVEALKHYRRGLELRPDSVALMNNVAWILATHPDLEIRQAEDALRLAQQAADRTHHAAPYLLDTLAAAYANQNQYDRAVETARTALELLTEPDQEAVRRQIRGRLELYEQGQAYREKNNQ